MSSTYTLKPFYLNLNDVLYLLQQVNFVPLFDAQGNAVVNWDGSTAIYDTKGVLLSNGSNDAATQTALIEEFGRLNPNTGTYVAGFPQVSSPIGIRDVTGYHNNLFGTQAEWGSADVPFRRDIAANFDNYATTSGTAKISVDPDTGTLTIKYADGSPDATLLLANYSSLTSTAGLARITLDTGAAADSSDDSITFVAADGTKTVVDLSAVTAYTNKLTGQTIAPNYETIVGANGTVFQASVVDFMPRVISRTITTAGVNLLKDANGNFVNFDKALYDAGTNAAYNALIDGSGVNITQLVDGAKIVVPSALSLTWDSAAYAASNFYRSGINTLVSSLGDGHIYGSTTGGPPVDGGTIFYSSDGVTFDPLKVGGVEVKLDVLSYTYRSLVDALDALDPNFSRTTAANGVAIAVPETFVPPIVGDVSSVAIVASLQADHGYGLLEQLGHIDFQNPTSGEYFIGSENPGVAPVNSWFGIFGQFFDHGLDFIDKGGQGTKITIALDPSDPLYRAPGTNGPGDQGYTAISVARATVAGADANNDPNYVNHTSPFIDQSQTYGSSEQITQILREWVSTDGGATYRAGIELFDGATLQDAWERRWPDGTSTMVNDTLPTLNELRAHLLATGRDDLSWEDVSNLRNRDLATGDVLTGTGAGNSGHALILDMNPHFDKVQAGNGHIDLARLQAIDIHVTGITSGGPGIVTISYDNGPDKTLKDLVRDDFSIKAVGTDAGQITQAQHDVANEILLESVGDHYIAGDGRVNENFGLTSIHHVFHEEHNYQVENLKTWIYAHDLNNPGAADAHEQLHNWQDTTAAFQDSFGNYMFNNTDVTEVSPGVFKANADNVAWDADKMFNATKLIVEMEYQHAAVDQYARTITPRIQEFVGYSTGVDSTVSLEYAQVAFRFGHSTIRETIDVVDPSGWMLGHVTRFALEKAFLAPQTFAEKGAAAITLGLTRQQMNEVDEFVTPALNQGLLGQPLDLAAINLARGRDLGIPTLNEFRDAISLAKYTSWSDFGVNMVHPESLVNFIAAYSFGGDVAKAQYILDRADGLTPSVNPFGVAITASDAVAFLNNNTTVNAELNTARDGFNHIDAWIGGLAEAHVPGGLLGETFDAVFVAQIQSLMDGDRFYYLYRLFGTNIHEEVNNGQFKDIVERNTGLSHLNGSIFAYADKYYDFNRGADGTLTDTTGDHANHLYADLLTPTETRGIYSDGGASTDDNGSNIGALAADGIRTDAPLDFIRDVRPELDPTQAHPLEGTPTSGADSHEVIVATDNRDYIHARGGDDTVYGEGGDDYIYGDGGIDRLYGGDGNDLIDTGEGPDLADGGAGKDIIYGRGSGSEVGGFDQLVGGTGNDLVIGGEGIDKLSGGAGDDIIYGDGLTNPEMGNTDAFTHGGDGNDYIDTGASGDLLYGEEGDDYLVGGIDQDLIQGGVGDDIIRPGSPSQAINGGPDEVIGDDGYVNTGFDLIDFSDYAANAPGVVITFSTQTNPLPAIDGTTPFPAWFQMEGAIGSKNGDTFTGDSTGDATATISLGNNWLIGGSGNDIFTGAGGDDLIVGGSVRLDQLIGKYSDAGAEGNLVLGSQAWISDAMQTGTGGTGYGNNTEDAYTGASNRATGTLGGGLLEAAGLNNLAHFQDMLASRMFKDLLLGDGGSDGTDTAIFSGSFDQYTITFISGGGLDGYKVAGVDGTDLLVGVENLQFTGALNINAAENVVAPINVAGLTGLTITGGADAAKFQLDGGALTFLTAPDFEVPTDTNANNIYEVTVQGTTVDGFSVTQALTVSVTNADEAGSNVVNITNAVRGAGNRVTMTGTNIVTDPDAPVTPTYQWSTGGTAATITVQATNAVQNITLTGGYTDALGAKPGVLAPETVVVGTGGNNTLNGTAGTDFMFGLGGNDAYDVNTAGDTVNEAANEGNDTVRTSLSTYTLGANIENLEFNNGAIADVSFTATGNTLSNNLTGGTADDTFVMITDNARDNVNGSGGVDTANYSAYTAGLTVNLAGGGNVSVNGSGSNNDNRDRLQSIENFIGGSGNDDIAGGNGNNRLAGGSGNDTLRYNVATNNGNLTSGRDIIDGGDNTGNGDTFVLTGSNGGETFKILTRAEALANIAGLTLEDGTEIVVTRQAAGTANNVFTNAAVVAELDNIEEITVNGFNSTANNGNDPNAPDSGSANGDTIQVIGNFTTTSLNYSTITVNGGSGADIVDITGLDSGHRIVFNTGTGADKVLGTVRNQDTVNRTYAGTSGNDDLGGGRGNDTLHGKAGNDLLRGGNGNDKAFGGAGNDRFTADKGADAYDGGVGSDSYLAGNATHAIYVNLATGVATGADFGRDTLVSVENVYAGSGNDTLIGDNLSNILSGGAGSDFIAGGGGGDVIRGGAGNDIERGGAGADKFVFERGFGNDVIADFDSNSAGGQDHLDLSALGITSANFAEHIVITDTGADVVIKVDGTSSITLKNVSNISDVTMEDFTLF